MPMDELPSAVRELLSGLLDAMPALTNAQRLSVFEQLTDGYCKQCGRADSGCRCWDDE